MLDVILLSFVSLLFGRFAFLLREDDGFLSGPRVSSERSKYGVLFLLLFLSFAGVVLPFSLEVSQISRILNIVVGFLWVYSFLPSRSLRPPSVRHFFAPSPSRKLVLFVLYLVSIWHPSFFIIFYGLCFFVFRERFKFISNAEVYLPYNVSTVLVGYHCINIFHSLNDDVFITFLSIVIGFHYLPSGWNKLQNHWSKINFLPNICAGANIQNNWGVTMGAISFSIFSSLCFIIQPTVVFVQCVSFLSIIDAYFCMVVFSLLLLMHLFVFISTGIFFWKWMLCLIGAILVLYISPPISPLASLEGVFVFGLSIITAHLLGVIPVLSWLDSPLCHKITISLKSGDLSYEVNPYDLNPLDMHLSQGRIGTCYPSDDYDFSGCFGALAHSQNNSSFLSKLNVLSNAANTDKAQVMAILSENKDKDRSQNNVYFDYHYFVSILLDRLKDLCKPQGFKKYFPHYHIWNLRGRDNLTVLKKLLERPDISIIFKRDVYFFSRHTMSYIKLYDSQKEIKLL